MLSELLAENLIGLLTLLFAIPGALFAFIQWHRDQAWKRTTAAFERLQSFYETPGTRNAMMILKSPKREIPLWDPQHPPTGGPYTMVTWEGAKWALIPTSWDAISDNKLTAIRDSFEDFMDRMTQIEMFLDAGLLDEADVCHLVEPWAKRLGGTTARRIGDGGLSRNFRVYVDSEDKTAVQHLFARYGVDLRQTLAEDRRGFEQEFAERLGR
jgi:hypothetical protein